jgi:hypothetical protein
MRHLTIRHITVLLVLLWPALSAYPAHARPADGGYRVILWCGDTVARNRGSTQELARACRELGVTALMTGPAGDPGPWRALGLDYYVENIVSPGLCLKFRSSVTDWSAFITQWMKTRSPDAFTRDVCLSDPAWRARARADMRRAAERHAPWNPLLYDIRDELSVTVSANPFDYDFAPASLAALRLRLRRHYPSLDALNAAWLTRFNTWEAVRPFSTDEIKARLAGRVEALGRQPDWAALRAMRYTPQRVRAEPERWHLAPWCDFRTFMDDTLAETLADLRDGAREADPATPVGIEGTQMPSAWGGYDLWKLSRVLDWVEPYDITAARAIFGSFMRGKPLFATYGESDPAAVSRRLWHLLLEGDCGAILWWSEDLLEGEGPALRLSAKGRALAQVVREMHTPLARRLLQAERLHDPVAIHYSQASIQLAWLFESFEDGATWPRRFSSYEAHHNRHAALRTDLLRALREAGWSPHFVSYEEVEAGKLEKEGFHTCLLPDAFALSDREVRALRGFARKPGNRLLYTGEPGVFNANGTPRAQPLFTASTQTVEQLVAVLPPPAVRIATPGSGVCIYRFRDGAARFFALEQRQQGQVSDDVTAHALPARRDAVRVSFAYDERRPLFDLRTGAQVGAEGFAEIEVPFERPAILGFAVSNLTFSAACR